MNIIILFYLSILQFQYFTTQYYLCISLCCNLNNILNDYLFYVYIDNNTCQQKMWPFYIHVCVGGSSYIG